MKDVTIRSTGNRDLTLESARLELLRQKFSGPLLTRESPGYEEARRIWNAMIDRRPALIGRCQATSDVQEAVRFARDHDLLISVRGGACIEWSREGYHATLPFATGGVYVNFLTQDEGERVQAAYGANHDRLRALKTRYDPDNLFRLNQNIRPGPSA